jgi:soluble lytic murein transglycosylase-like protein
VCAPINLMKLFATALSVPAACLCGAMTIAGLGVFERTLAFLSPSPPKPAATLPTPPPFHLDQIVRVMARKHGVRQGFIKSIIAAESAGHQEVISPRGAIGLMQLMPDTARDLGIDPAILEQNVEGGAKYLEWLLRRYESQRNGLERAIAAYNAGPGNVDKYRGIPPFRETRDYVRRVLAFYRKFEGFKGKGTWTTALRRATTNESSD